MKLSGATLTPFFNVINGYEADTDAFYRSFAMFLIWMAVLCVFYVRTKKATSPIYSNSPTNIPTQLIAALRTNLCLVAVLLCFVITFPCLAASYFAAANGLLALSNTTRVVGGAFAFIASMVAWYLWFSMILESVDFPLVLPVGDLSHFIKGRSEMSKEKKSEREMA